MSPERWRTLTHNDRIRLADWSGLTKQLLGHEGHMVEVEDWNGVVRRFYVARSGGQRPVHVELEHKTDKQGERAARSYKSVRRIVPNKIRAQRHRR